ncbi:MAG: D-alanine--D-alanine ligase [Thermodesulfobacteriota bacterium]|nr:D-alanine--D-alanine ligase [Thermodesulfobacteriota bacterium]
MWKDKKVGVLFGGLSTERDISLLSGNAIICALKGKGYNVFSIDVGKDIVKKLLTEKIDVAFIALHGRWGEDGTIQGMLEIMGIPYTGSGVLASALAMNKWMTKKILMFHRLQTPEFQFCEAENYLKDRPGEDIEMGYPLVVKPVSEGSTLGISIVKNKRQLSKAKKEAFRFNDQIIIEEFIDGLEITVGILNGAPLPVIEIIPKSGFYDYESKYTSGMTEYIFPARLANEQLSEVKNAALKAYTALGCHGAARVDMILDAKGNANILEINTVPGMTKTSLLPKAAYHAGYDFHTLVEQMLESARLHSQ